ncbi:MAG: 50S ribosomal protein L5 [Candidatus Babeliaceae bacterium]
MANKNSAPNVTENRLKNFYKTQIRKNLQEKLNLKNTMEVPQVSKVVLNVGIKTSEDSKALQAAFNVLTTISGQKAVKTLARKSIAGFKLREDMQVGVMVTMRGERMYAFLDKFINLALPKVRDFQGVSPKSFDGRGNYNLGVKEWNIFPETESLGVNEKIYGLNITITTTAKNNEKAFVLLQELGVPFRINKV